MKPITKRRQPLEEKQCCYQAKTAQCCAKSSRTPVGCHD